MICIVSEPCRLGAPRLQTPARVATFRQLVTSSVPLSMKAESEKRAGREREESGKRVKKKNMKYNKDERRKSKSTNNAHQQHYEMTHVQPRIVPWSSPDELQLLKQWFYPYKTGTQMDDSRSRAILKVNSYQTKGSYVPHTVDCTAQLTNATLLDERICSQPGGEAVSNLPVRLCYTMSIIRFVNGLLDPSQQSQFAIPLHTLADRIKLPSWFVELRHCGTHERDLPSLEMLRLACKEALEWLWLNYWDNDETAEEEQRQEVGQDREKKGGEGRYRQQECDGENTGPANGRDGVHAESVEALQALLSRYKDTHSIIAQNEHLWKGSVAISRSSFTGDHCPAKGKKRERTPDDEVGEFVADVKSAWKGMRTSPEIFLDTVFERYNGKPYYPLFELLISRIDSFDYELFRWLIGGYHRCVSSSQPNLMRDKLDAIQLQRLVAAICQCVNFKKLLNNHARWTSLFAQHPSYLTLVILKDFEKSISNTFKDKKTRKRFENENVLERLREMIGNFEKRFNRGELQVYDLSTGSRQSRDGSIDAAEGKRGVRAVAQVNDVLQDLAGLKQRFKKVRSTSDAKNWCTPAVWEPKPFGCL